MKVILFSAQWCGPCKRYKPVFEQLTQEKSGEADFEIRDIDHDDLATKLKIQGVPTVVIFDNDREISRADGAEKISSMLEKIFSPETP